MPTETNSIAAKLPNNGKIWHQFNIKVPQPSIVVAEVLTPQPDKEYIFIIKKPSRAEREEGDWQRSFYTTFYIEKGLLSESVLRKKLEDSGGIMSKRESQEYVDMQLGLLNLEKEYQLLKIENKDEEAKLKYIEWTDVQRKIISFESEQSRTYENSAEAKARNKMIQYFTYELLYWLPNADDKEYLPYFIGTDFETKQKYAFEKDDGDDEIYKRCILLAELYVSALLFSRGQMSSESLDNLPKEMGLLP